MMRDAMTLACTRHAQVVTYAELGPGRDTRTIACGLGALYIAADHDPTLMVDITDVFGGITPEPASEPKTLPACGTATDAHAVYFGWEWFSMSWPGNPDDSSYGSVS